MVDENKNTVDASKIKPDITVEFGEPDNQTTPYLTVRGGTVSGGGLISGSAISTAS